ncbi:Bax inhibitor-1/YccA family protein [Pleionea sp. CnH1-48]|uniref:Bax inhibitor-1/YccA family protein n=1 Tax=Pleionea sp. CnH1-48 TaxID=2954494 RepID=UPI002096FFD3|nr:Bax inhibitor-1/YccA family protein [Pleionea sp. CnH1-48]MCO7222746.1 Bax inhibitor-1/YccA family protein [Pleionea sp. CnH1-48]
MEYNTNAVAQPTGSAIEINKVLKNTYMLLGALLLFSGVTAFAAAAMGLPRPNVWIILAGFYGLLFLVHKTQNSPAGIFSAFALTGFMGYTLGPILGMIMANAPQIVAMALGGTGLIFFGLSAYVLTTKKDMSFMSGFMVAGAIVLMVAVVANLFLQIPALSLAISAAFMLFSSAAIMWQTSAIIHGGERNYIVAAVGIFVSLYNIFVSLLQLLMAFGGDD